MAPKKATGAAPAKKAATAPSHPSYKDMIKEALLTLKERNGSSRQALKKYILANHKNLSATPAQFDQQFNKALRTGVEKGDFTQPKGSSGPVKLAKKEAAPKKTTDAAAKKPSDTKPKKAAAPKKSTTAAKPKASTTKKASTTTKKAAPKANTSTKRKTKAAPETAPAVVDVPKVLSKTKSGRVTKTPAKAASKPAAKKATGAKKPGAPKKSTPKKAAAPAVEAST